MGKSVTGVQPNRQNVSPDTFAAVVNDLFGKSVPVKGPSQIGTDRQSKPVTQTPAPSKPIQIILGETSVSNGTNATQTQTVDVAALLAQVQALMQTVQQQNATIEALKSKPVAAPARPDYWFKRTENGHLYVSIKRAADKTMGQVNLSPEQIAFIYSDAGFKSAVQSAVNNMESVPLSKKAEEAAAKK